MFDFVCGLGFLKIKKHIITLLKSTYIYESNIFFGKKKHIHQYKRFYGSILSRNINNNWIMSKCDLIYANIVTMGQKYGFYLKNNIHQCENLKKCSKKMKQRYIHISKKIVHISWNITEHDLKHRLRIAMRSLDKGYNIDVLIGSRKIKGEFELHKREEMLKKVREAFLRKGNERKPAIGTMNGLYTLYFEPKKNISLT
ncbi:hypothetical protein PCANB_002394 [Pneumocystis canis]|nr:hypothetical protein PCK1_002534 [Pneumocystis canis]KAG5438675.1 hypothetical protein PCANB_002394 [Pneumocystis canis]